MKDLSNQILEAWELADKVRVPKYNKILVCGMGASGFTGNLLRDNFSSLIIEVNKSYNIPAWVDKETLVFAVSYSGKTKETISAAQKANKNSAYVVAISSNPRMLKAKQRVKIPSNLIPREAIAYLFFPVLRILTNSRIVKVKTQEIKQVASLLSKEKNNIDKLAIKLATPLQNKIPIAWTSPNYDSLGIRFQNELNENAKHFAHHKSFTELCHNEIEANVKNARGFVIMFIDSKNKNAKLQIDATRQIIPNNIQASITLKGKTKLEKLFWGILFCWELSYRLAEKKRVNPIATHKIDALKRVIKHGKYMS